jgi:hypothetical protein
MHTAAIVLALLSASPDKPSDEAVLTLGRRLSADFWAGRLDPVWAQMDEKMRAALGGSPAGLSDAREKLLRVSGGPGKTLGERVADVQGLQVYLRTFQGTDAEKPALEQWAIQDGTSVAGFFVRPTELTVETLPEPARAPRYVLAGGLMATTALAMGALGLWLKRPKKTG